MTLLRPAFAKAMKGFAGLAMMLAFASAHAQNAPLSGLAPRGTVQPTDIIPILPAGGAQLQQTTVSALLAGGGAGAGSVTSVTCGAGLNGGTITTTGTCSLANPSATTLGGIESLVAVAHQFVTGISTSGVPALAQPACGDLSNAATSCSTDATNASNIGSGTLNAARLPASGVTPGSYASANITVDVAGRVTAASNGAVGPGGTFYVNASTGSDSNACTTSGAACLTIGHALSLVPKVITGAYVINVADGTYAECLDIGGYLGPVGSTSTPYLSIIGDVTTQANVILTGSCTWPGTAGNVTYSIHDFTPVAVSVEGITTNPTSLATIAEFSDYGSVLLLHNVTLGHATYGVAAFHHSLVNVFGTVNINGWTQFGVFTGLGATFSNYDIGSTTLSLTPNSLGVACLHAEVGSTIDIDTDTNGIASGTVTCPGGSNNVTSFADADNASATFVKFPVTAVNASTPSGSQILYARHGSNVFINAALTATNWTYSCTAYEAGSGDQGTGGRTFTNVGGNNILNTGECVLF